MEKDQEYIYKLMEENEKMKQALIQIANNDGSDTYDNYTDEWTEAVAFTVVTDIAKNTLTELNIEF
jgi:hypothetical protein